MGSIQLQSSRWSTTLLSRVQVLIIDLVVVFFVVTLLGRFSSGNLLYYSYTTDEPHAAGIGLQTWASIHAFAALVPVPQYPGSLLIPGCQTNHDHGPDISGLTFGLVP
jgi:hypothetical protein